MEPLQRRSAAHPGQNLRGTDMDRTHNSAFYLRQLRSSAGEIHSCKHLLQTGRLTAVELGVKQGHLILSSYIKRPPLIPESSNS
ncbi:hypothetical protein AOLI_G00029270 [Acnodon oligacanthus]